MILDNVFILIIFHLKVYTYFLKNN